MFNFTVSVKQLKHYINIYFVWVLFFVLAKKNEAINENI